MARRMLLITAALLLMATTGRVYAAGRTTVDPNTIKKPGQAVPAAVKDKRLDQKIEYDAGNARLHKVIDDLAKMSGVTIYCGKDADDWQVRDIPVTVAARGIALRDLLNHIVGVTHNQLLAKKTEKGVLYYRIITDPRVQKALDDYERALKDYQTAMAAWSLEAASKLKDIPASSIKTLGMGPEWLACQIEASKMLAVMDPDMKKSALAGETIYLSPASTSGAMKQAVLGFLNAKDYQFVSRVNAFVARMAGDGNGANYREVTPASADEIEKSQVRIGLNGEYLSIRVAICTQDKNRLGYQGPYSDSTREMAGRAMDSGRGLLNLPHQPIYPRPPIAWPKPQGMLPAFIPNSPEPLLSQKIAVKMEDDSKTMYTADALMAISKASGMTVVCQDFQTHRHVPGLKNDFPQELPLCQALMKALYTDWWLNPSTNSLVAWSDWLGYRTNLLPARVVDNLVAKANGDGVDLDDLACLSNYSGEGVQDWLNTLKGIPFYPFAVPANRQLWRFYDALSPAEKAQAKSAAGLELGTRDLTQVVQGLRDADNGWDIRFAPVDGQRSPYERLASKDVIPTLKIRIQTCWNSAAMQAFDDAASGHEAKNLVPEGVPAGYKMRRDYRLIIEGVDNGEKVSVDIATGYNDSLPYFTPEREEALAKAVSEARDKEPAKKLVDPK